VQQRVGKLERACEFFVSSCSSFCRTRTLHTQGAREREREREKDDDRNTHISVYSCACIILLLLVKMLVACGIIVRLWRRGEQGERGSFGARLLARSNDAISL